MLWATPEVCGRRQSGASGGGLSVTRELHEAQATAELYDEEGFQRTGDVCEQQGPDVFVWIDRVSNIIKLSQGEYVSVSRLEALYAANSPSIHQMYLYGNSLRAYLVAIVVAQQGKISRPRRTSPHRWLLNHRNLALRGGEASRPCSLL